MNAMVPMDGVALITVEPKVDIVTKLENFSMSKENQKIFEQINQGLEGKVGPEAPDEDPKTFKFLEEDEEFQQKLADGGSNPLANVDQWARNRLNRFRQCMGLETSIPFEDLPPRDCVRLLCKFYERVTKVNGELYPTYTLMGLYRAFNRMLRRHQERRVLETGVEEVPLNMRMGGTYHSVGVACVISMERSRTAGANKPRKKAEVVSYGNEVAILAHQCMQIHFPRGLQWRTFYFLEFRFAIRGGEELYKVLKDNFEFGVNQERKYVKYDERLSKNHKVSLDCYQDEHFRDPVIIFDPDVVETLEAMILHLPAAAKFMFMQCIDGPRKIAWFNSSLRTGERTLCNLMKVIHQTCGLDHQGIVNKSGRTTVVTRMKMSGVPDAVGQRITGHKSSAAYSRYDRSVESQVQAAQMCIAEGGSYGEHLQGETLKFRQLVLDGPDVANAAKKLKLDVEQDNGEANRAAKGIMEVPAEQRLIIEKPKSLDTDDMDINSLKSKLIEWDTWANRFDWNSFEEKGMEGRHVNVNPLTAVFGHIKTMSNCHVSINIQHLTGS